MRLRQLIVIVIVSVWCGAAIAGDDVDAGPSPSLTPLPDVAQAAADLLGSAHAERQVATAPLLGAPAPRRLVAVHAAHVRALVAGSLDATVDPASLFEVPLDDEAAVVVDARRLRLLLDAASGGVDAGASDDFAARLELDRARLAFYDLDVAAREALLVAHAERRAALVPAESTEARRKRQDEAERQRALTSARDARTEAARLAGEELARLITLEGDVAAIEGGFLVEAAELNARSDIILGWQRRARSAKPGAEADDVYEALRTALRRSRDELSGALDVIATDDSAVADVGADPLVDVDSNVDGNVDVNVAAARAHRVSVERAIAKARRAEQDLRAQRATVLLDEIAALNRERLRLLGSLSSHNRDAITGVSIAAWDQARSEARHLGLILRFHRQAATTWLTTLRNDGASGTLLWRTATVIVPAALLASLFLWLRRRTPQLLRVVDERLAESDARERRTTPSRQRRAVAVVARVHRSVEWGVFFACAFWLLPHEASGLLEAELLASIVGWIIGGAVVVDVINALAAGDAGGGRDEVEALRLRSLKFVSRTVIVFALLLVLSARLVGQGTIYQWVLSTCWLASVPVFLVLVRWWRTTVFTRMDRARKKTPLQAWVLSNRAGWRSFIAAMVGAVDLFVVGAVKSLVALLAGFDLARRIHAWLFKREIERMGSARRNPVSLAPLSATAMKALHPEQPPTQWLASPADDLLAELLGRAERRRGGVFVVVGGRGMGKSALLRELAARTGAGPVVNATDVLASASALKHAAVVLVDAVEVVVKPVIGGLAAFDAIVSWARAHSAQSMWVLSVDAAVWPFVKRARDARPLFDETYYLEPWNEAQLGALLGERSAQAGITPAFDDLLDDLPPGADDVDRLEALRATQVGYERMLWDHVGGNPALALEVWRSSLGVDDAGVARVRALQIPDAARLDSLPDSSLFILRAVLQLEPASVDDIADATRLGIEQVQMEIRFGEAQGFFADVDGRVRVTWGWLRAILHLLERRHILVNR